MRIADSIGSAILAVIVIAIAVVLVSMAAVVLALGVALTVPGQVCKVVGRRRSGF